MSFSMEKLGEQIIFKKMVDGAAIIQITLEKVAGSSPGFSLTIKTSDVDKIRICETSGWTLTVDGAFIATESEDSIIKALEDAFQLADGGLPPLELYDALHVTKTSPVEPFEVVDATAETRLAVHGFFGARGGAGAASVPVALPSSQTRELLQGVAKGRQREAEVLLTATPVNTQTLLRTPGTFTDYSGRTFNCTAYEYAYWAKDTHMCRMLESHMDEETKAQMLARIDSIEASGLTFQQNDTEYRSAHFDLTELKTALQAYIDGYDAWYSASNWVAMKAAWMVVGKAQRNVPAHIAQEYCREDRSFTPTPRFNEEAFPRSLTFYNFNTRASDSWFPQASSNSGLGFDFALIRGVVAPSVPAGGMALLSRPGLGRPPHGGWLGLRYGVPGARLDLAAITRLDEVRTVDLTLLRDHLNPSESVPGMSM